MLFGQRVKDRQGIPDRFNAFNFDAVKGQVPVGWERGWSPEHNLRMRPIGMRTFWLDFSSDKVVTTSDGHARPASAVAFLKSVNLFGDSGRYEAPARDRAIVVHDYVEIDSGMGTPIRTRASYVALTTGDTAYVIVATFSQATRTLNEPFAQDVIAIADRVVRGLRVDRRPASARP
jgi:hypothetical protein